MWWQQKLLPILPKNGRWAFFGRLATVTYSGDTLLWDNRQANNRTRLAGPAYSRLIGYTRIYSANIVPTQEQLI